MKLVLYSGGQNRSNRRLHSALSYLAGKRKNKSFAYFPYCDEGGMVYFNRAKKRYRQFGFNRFHYFPIDNAVIAKKKALRKKVFSSDVIYLAGGNTFYILHHLRKQGLLGELKAFVKRGGVIAGLSAGALILTPSIRLAGYPKFDCDKNEIKLKNLKSLGVVPFEFFPHYSSSTRLNRALSWFSKRHTTPIIACENGGGIIVADEEVISFGKGVIFFRGKKVRLDYHTCRILWT